jgi:hypothetical protein
MRAFRSSNGYKSSDGFELDRRRRHKCNWRIHKSKPGGKRRERFAVRDGHHDGADDSLECKSHQY